MRNKIVLTTTALLLLPFGLEAQQASARSTASAEARVQGETRSENVGSAEGRIETALQTAVDAGIPAFVLDSKVEEGRAKGVPAERIAAAVEARLAALLRARTTIQERVGFDASSAAAETRSDVSLLVATADAIQANVDVEALARVWAAASGESRALATATTAQLVQLGHASADAALRVTTALQRGGGALHDLSASATAALGARGGLGGASLQGAASGAGSVPIRN